jgi:hypothetical protein
MGAPNVQNGNVVVTSQRPAQGSELIQMLLTVTERAIEALFLPFGPPVAKRSVGRSSGFAEAFKNLLAVLPLKPDHDHPCQGRR